MKEETTNRLIETNLFIDFMVKHGINVKTFCKMCNMTQETFNNIMMQNFTIKAVYSLYDIAKVLNMPFSDLYTK